MNDVEIVRRWNRRFLYLFWFALALYIILALVAVMMHPGSERLPLAHRTLGQPIIPLVLLVGLLHLASKRFPQSLPVFLVLGTYIAVYIVAHALYDMLSPVTLLLLPILFSTIYLKKHIMAISVGVSVLELGLLYATIYRPQGTISSMDLLVFLGTLIVAGAVGFMIVVRGQELLRSLWQNVQAKEELMMQNAWNERMSKFDTLTELYNKASFQDYLSRVVEVCSKHEIPLHLAVIDIDDFKHINDTFGHDVGDRVLRDFATHLLETLPEQYFVARYGGEEFVVIGTELPTEDFVGHVQQLREQTSVKIFSGHKLTISVGVHSYTRGESLDEFFRLADQGLYWSKNHGKNRVGLSENILRVN